MAEGEVCISLTTVMDFCLRRLRGRCRQQELRGQYGTAILAEYMYWYHFWIYRRGYLQLHFRRTLETSSHKFLTNWYIPWYARHGVEPGKCQFSCLIFATLVPWCCVLLVFDMLLGWIVFDSRRRTASILPPFNLSFPFFPPPFPYPAQRNPNRRGASIGAGMLRLSIGNEAVTSLGQIN